MDSHEFNRLLLLFPVVRTRHYSQADAQSSRQATSGVTRNEVRDWQDAWGEQETKTQDVFWGKLRSAAEQKVGSAGAEKFCDAFQKIYHRLVYKELSKEVIENYLNSC
ncbi:uncharacterized protein LOC141657770 [Silene latifolia]|uniref:uncharacterized protein LOC141657770 n=1 Tax=Silene latifolia TaxID=37657 RepID=UPI003D771C8C